ncbi:MAG: NADPH-dependent F420 reductase [Verrucomicrobiota bacterium]|nr:NADPH-dependent F420 reductase [Verrucomicrobiota bacterium]
MKTNSVVSHVRVRLNRRKFVVAGLGLAAMLVTVICAGAPTETPAAQASKDPVKPMRIGVIGAGSLGGTVGRVLVQAGHEVMFSSRHPEELASMIRDLGPRASTGTSREAAEFGTVLLFAVPYDALPELGRDLKDVIRGKIVLDACNPPGASENALAREAKANGVGPTSPKYLPGTRLVRAFSAVDATAVDASFKRQSDKLGVPLAGDDVEALQVAAQLVRDAGCEPVIVGNLAAGTSFQRNAPGFRANTTAAKLRALLGLTEGK